MYRHTQLSFNEPSMATSSSKAMCSTGIFPGIKGSLCCRSSEAIRTQTERQGWGGGVTRAAGSTKTTTIVMAADYGFGIMALPNVLPQAWSCPAKPLSKLTA